MDFAALGHLDDLGKRRPLVLYLTGASLGRALDVLALALADLDRDSEDPFQPVTAPLHLVAHFDYHRFAVERLVRQREAAVTDQQVLIPITVGEDLADICVQLDVAIQLIAALLPPVLLTDTLEAVHRRLEMARHLNVIRGL